MIPDATGPSSQSGNSGASGKIVNSGALLFLTQLLISAGGWLFWLIISKVITASEVGQAISVYGIVLLIVTFAQLGFEYPLLRRASISGERVFGTALIIEIILTCTLIPFAIFFVDIFYHESLQDYLPIVIVMLILSPVSFVSRYSLMGITDIKTVLIAEVLGTGTKLLTGILLVSMGYGVSGVLLSFLLAAAVTTALTLSIAQKKLSFKIGNLEFAKGIMKEALANAPPKLAGTIVYSLIIVLLASIGVNDSEIGVFYMALMISTIAGGLASSISFMVIPVSTRARSDLSLNGARIGMSLTVPIISALIVAPQLFLSIIGENYRTGDMALLVLSIAILPSIVVINTIAKYNNLRNSKGLIFIGVVKISVFLASFFVFVPSYGIVGGAFAFLLAFVATAILIMWSEKALLRYVAISVIAIAAGIALGEAVKLAFFDIHQVVPTIIAFAASLISIIMLKGTTIQEIRRLLNDSIKRSN